MRGVSRDVGQLSQRVAVVHLFMYEPWESAT